MKPENLNNHPAPDAVSSAEAEDSSVPHRISIRWKLFFYLAVFVGLLLLVLWLFQIVFLGDVYRNIKVNEINTTADVLKRELASPQVSDTIDDTVDTLSEDNQVCIEVLDSSFHPVTHRDHLTCYTQGADSSCFVHQTENLSLRFDLMRFVFLSAIRNSGEVYFQDTSQGSQKLEPGEDGLVTVPPPGSALPTDTASTMLYIEYLEVPDTGGYYIILNSKVTPVNATVNTLKHELAIISIAFIFIAVIMAMVISHGITAPIIKINHAAKQLASGDYNTVFEGDGYKEISELQDTLNYAATELSKVEGFRRELLANISHDLRTPLTMITGYSEVMRDLPGENTPENVQVIIDEASRLTTLVNDLLDLSKLQSGSASFEPSVFSLTDCVKSIIGRYQKLTENDGYNIDFQYDGDVCVRADYSKLQQVIYNLTNNAISYTGEDKKIVIRQTVSAGDAGKQKVRISVIDTGVGISKENLEHIWDRYFKENKTHKRAVVGTGLGLSIVKGVLNLHHAKFGVDTSEDPVTHGTTFWFELEITDPPSEEP